MGQSSKLWDKLTAEEFASVDDTFLSTFRAPSSANKFVAWDPYERSTRYLQFLLFTVAARKTSAFFDAYRRLGATDVGAPLAVRVGGCAINADYLAAVEEWEFMTAHDALRGADRVVEIGAGFGRTCHTLLTLCPDIVEYTIVDLAPMLRLSSSYLSRVAPSVYGKVRFVASDDLPAQAALGGAGLAINIDSFQEMPPEVIDGYMDRIVSRASKFYSKNAVGKYRPETVGLPPLRPDQLLDVFDLGYCRKVLDVFDDDQLRSARAECLELYRPKGSGDWSLSADQPMSLFPYFLHALYSRGTAGR